MTQCALILSSSKWHCLIHNDDVIFHSKLPKAYNKRISSELVWMALLQSNYCTQWNIHLTVILWWMWWISSQWLKYWFLSYWKLSFWEYGRDAEYEPVEVRSGDDNGGGEHGPLWLNISNLPRDPVEAPPEVGVEDLSDRRFGQTFPADRYSTLGSAESVQLPPPPSDPTHHQVVISWQLRPSLHPSVQDIRFLCNILNV